MGRTYPTRVTPSSQTIISPTTGAPVSGAYAAQQMLLDSAGVLYVCTAAGSPGTWQQAGAGVELAYAEVTAGNLTTTAVGAANKVDAAGLVISATVPNRPVLVEAFFTCQNSTLNSGVGFHIVEAAAGATGTPVRQQSQMISAGVASAAIPATLRVRLNPGAGTYSWKVMFYATVSGTATIGAISTQPAFIRCVTC